MPCPLAYIDVSQTLFELVLFLFSYSLSTEEFYSQPSSVNRHQ